MYGTENRDAHRVLVGKTEEMMPLVRDRQIWEDNIEIYLKEISFEGTDLINLDQDRDK
jgi:hypothetical protein